jgi:protein-tyrosine-phosphatase
VQTVLFVCVENSCRSQMAEAFGKMLGSGVITAFSSGSRPSGIVNDKAVASMKELGYDLSTHRSKSLADMPAIEYDVVVTMGCDDACPSVRAKQRVEWNIPDPRAMDREQFADVRDLIKAEVHRLVQSLRSR